MGVKAVRFDTDTTLINNYLPSVPYRTDAFFISYWYRGRADATIFEIIGFFYDYMLQGPGGMSVIHGAPSQAAGAYHRLNLFCNVINFFPDYVDDDDQDHPAHFNYDGIGLLGPDIPQDDNWHHVMVSMTNPVEAVVSINPPPNNLEFYEELISTCKYSFDNVVGDMVRNGFSGSSDSFEPNPTYITLPIGDTTIGNGGLYIGSGGAVFEMAEVFVFIGTPIDITDPAVRAKFIDPDTLLPVPIDAGGLWPFCDSLGVAPQIFLSGNADLFPRNYPGWSATCVSQTDSDPSSQFTVTLGNLTTADSDPFGQTATGV